MALGTFSKFYYGLEITTLSRYFDFDEGGSELTAEVRSGLFSPTDLAAELERSLNAVGTNLYTVTFNRSTRRLTISSDGMTFNIRSFNGSNAGTGIYSVIGIPTNANQTGATSYTGSAIGSVYITQFPPQSYTAAEDFVRKPQATVNRAASGFVEVIDYGSVSFIEFELLMITELNIGGGDVIRYNPTGVQDARDFFNYLIRKGPLEFMPDRNDSDTFYRVILESTPEDSNGLSFKLKEETDRNLPGIYRTGLLTFRVV